MRQLSAALATAHGFVRRQRIWPSRDKQGHFRRIGHRRTRLAQQRRNTTKLPSHRDIGHSSRRNSTAQLPSPSSQLRRWNDDKQLQLARRQPDGELRKMFQTKQTFVLILNLKTLTMFRFNFISHQLSRFIFPHFSVNRFKKCFLF